MDLPIHETSEDGRDQMFKFNLKPTFLTSKHIVSMVRKIWENS